MNQRFLVKHMFFFSLHKEFEKGEMIPLVWDSLAAIFSTIETIKVDRPSHRWTFWMVTVEPWLTPF